jgi:hypothetical protein
MHLSLNQCDTLGTCELCAKLEFDTERTERLCALHLEIGTPPRSPRIAVVGFQVNDGSQFACQAEPFAQRFFRAYGVAENDLREAFGLAPVNLVEECLFGHVGLPVHETTMVADQGTVVSDECAPWVDA